MTGIFAWLMVYDWGGKYKVSKATVSKKYNEHDIKF